MEHSWTVRKSSSRSGPRNGHAPIPLQRMAEGLLENGKMVFIDVVGWGLSGRAACWEAKVLPLNYTRLPLEF